MQIQRHLALRQLMAEGGDRNKINALMRITGLSRTKCAQMLSGRSPIAVDVAYAVLDYYHAPHDMLHVYFPPDGLTDRQREELAARERRTP